MKFRACEPGITGQDLACGTYDETCDLDLCDPCCGDEPEPMVDDGRYQAPFRRVMERLAAEEARSVRELTAADELYDRLMRLSRAQREASIRREGRFTSYPVAERLLSASREVRDDQPESSAELARLALAVADRLEPGRYGDGLVADLKARGWAYLGDLWSDSSPPAAREAFRLALGHLMQGSGDPLDEAEVLSLCANTTDDLEITLGRLTRPARPRGAVGAAPRAETRARRRRAHGLKRRAGSVDFGRCSTPGTAPLPRTTPPERSGRRWSRSRARRAKPTCSS